MRGIDQDISILSPVMAGHEAFGAGFRGRRPLVMKAAVVFLCVSCFVLWAGISRASGLGLSAEEQSYIEEHPVFTASNEANWPPFNFNVNGLPQGYSVDYMNMLAKMAGLKVEYVTGPDWDQFEHMLKNGTLDVVMNMAMSPSRMEYAAFTPPYAALVHGIVFRDGQGVPPTLDSLDGRTVAVPKGFFTEKVVRENYPGIIVITPPDTESCLKAVATGKADAAVGSLPVQNYLIIKHFLLNLQVRALVDNNHFPIVNIRFGVTNTKPLLAKILSKAMAAVGEKQLSELRRKWLSASREDIKYIPLTPSEQELISRMGTVRMCVHPDWMPFSRINSKGEFQGMVADYIRVMAGRLGVNLRLIPTESWDQSLEYLRQGKCDIIPAVSSTQGRKKFMTFTRAYLRFPIVAATLEDAMFVPDAASLAGKRVGVVPGSTWAAWIARDYPEVDLVEVPSVDQGLEMVQEHKIFAFVDTLAAVSYAIGKHHFTDIKIAGKLERGLSLSVGVSKQNPLLAQVFNMAVASLSEKERQDIFSNWISISFEHGFDYTMLWKILAGLAVGLAAVFFWVRKLVLLNRAVIRANADLNQANEKISTLLDNSGQGILSFGADGVVEPELSRECDRIFGKHVAGDLIQDILHPTDAKAGETFAMNIKRILTQEDSLKRELFISLMPGHFDLGDRQVDAEYKLLYGGRLMLVLSDVTDKRALEAEVEKEHKRLAMIVAAVRDKDDFFRVLEEFDQFIRARVRGEDVDGVDGGWDLPSLYRHVHTFKGLMLQLEFIHTPDALHQLETTLSKWREAGDKRVDREQLEEAWIKCGCPQALDSDLRNVRTTLGDAFFEQSRRISVPVDIVEGLEELAAHLSAITGKIGLEEKDYALLKEVGRLRQRDLRDMLAAYPEAVMKLARRTGKQVRPFSIEGDLVKVLPGIYEPLVSSLVHVFRNTVVHGIEDPDLRAMLGKPEAGNVSCRVEDMGDTVLIAVEDDGQGIDVQALWDKARKMGIEPSGDPEKDLNLVFEHDMTTRETADSLAGRGVGLFAVMDRLKRLGGTVRVTSVPGQGTTFRFILPKFASGQGPDR